MAMRRQINPWTVAEVFIVFCLSWIVLGIKFIKADDNPISPRLKMMVVRAVIAEYTPYFSGPKVRAIMIV